MLYPQEIRNYRDWLTVDVDLWRHYWFGMVNRGVMAQPYWRDEQWTMSVQHTEADIDKHIAAFDDIALSLAKAQQERAGKLQLWPRIRRIVWGGHACPPHRSCSGNGLRNPPPRAVIARTEVNPTPEFRICPSQPTKPSDHI